MSFMAVMNTLLDMYVIGLAGSLICFIIYLLVSAIRFSYIRIKLGLENDPRKE